MRATRKVTVDMPSATHLVPLPPHAFPQYHNLYPENNTAYHHTLYPESNMLMYPCAPPNWDCEYDPECDPHDSDGIFNYIEDHSRGRMHDEELGRIQGALRRYKSATSHSSKRHGTGKKHKKKYDSDDGAGHGHKSKGKRGDKHKWGSDSEEHDENENDGHYKTNSDSDDDDTSDGRNHEKKESIMDKIHRKIKKFGKKHLQSGGVNVHENPEHVFAGEYARPPTRTKNDMRLGMPESAYTDNVDQYPGLRFGDKSSRPISHQDVLASNVVTNIPAPPRVTKPLVPSPVTNSTKPLVYPRIGPAGASMFDFISKKLGGRKATVAPAKQEPEPTATSHKKSSQDDFPPHEKYRMPAKLREKIEDLHLDNDPEFTEKNDSLIAEFYSDPFNSFYQQKRTQFDQKNKQLGAKAEEFHKQKKLVGDEISQLKEAHDTESKQQLTSKIQSLKDRKERKDKEEHNKIEQQRIELEKNIDQEQIRQENAIRKQIQNIKKELRDKTASYEEDTTKQLERHVDHAKGDQAAKGESRSEHQRDSDQGSSSESEQDDGGLHVQNSDDDM